jgi:hypothetical protein
MLPHVSVRPTIWEADQEDHEFEVNPGKKLSRPYLKNKQAKPPKDLGAWPKCQNA